MTATAITLETPIPTAQEDSLRPEYDPKKLLKKAVRGKYAKRYQAETNLYEIADPNEALVLWEKIPEHGKQILVTHVWCGNCQTTTTILNFGGQVTQGDLVITGFCARCGGKVVRLIGFD